MYVYYSVILDSVRLHLAISVFSSSVKHKPHVQVTDLASDDITVVTLRLDLDHGDCYSMCDHSVI